MKDTIEYYSLYFALILVGVLLYGIGNIAFGKESHGGRRLVFLVVGLGMIGMTGVFANGVVFFWNEAQSWLGYVGTGLFALFGLACLATGVWFVSLGFSRDTKKIEKMFQKLIDSF